MMDENITTLVRRLYDLVNGMADPVLAARMMGDDEIMMVEPEVFYVPSVLALHLLWFLNNEKDANTKRYIVTDKGVIFLGFVSFIDIVALGMMTFSVLDKGCLDTPNGVEIVNICHQLRDKGVGLDECVYHLVKHIKETGKDARR